MCYYNFRSLNYAYFVRKIWPWIDLFLFMLIPFTLIVISNALLVHKLRRSLQRRSSSLLTGQMSDGQRADRQHKAIAITRTLIVVSTAFILLIGPNSIYITIQLFFSHYLLENSFYMDNFETIQEVLVNLSTVNSCINFFLYVLTGEKFRGELKQILLGCIPKKKSNDCK